MAYSPVINLFINLQDDAPIVYPNPVKDQFRLYSKTLNDNDEVFLLISDMTGRAVYKGKHFPINGQILLSTEQVNITKSGTYFLSFKNRGQAYTLEILNVSDR